MGTICPNYSRTTLLSLLITRVCVCICVTGGGGLCVCVCVYTCVVRRSVASQIEIDGQDDGEKDDGSEDEDQDAILDDPAERQTETDSEIRQGSQKSYCVHREK